MTISRHTALSYLASLLLFWLTFTQLSLGEKYDFIGMSTSGDPISLTGSFFGSDIDLDGTLEHPNGLLEMVNIDTTATLTSNGTLVSVPWSLGDVNSFAFQPVANSGLLTMLAHNETDDLINGNEVHNDSMLEIINGGNVATNMFSAWIDTSVANNSYDGFGSGPILISTQAIAPGPGIKFMYTMNFGEGGSHLDGGTLLGSFTIDDIDDIDDPVDLGDSRFQIRSSETLFVDATGAAMPWEFESGLSVPPTSGGTSSHVEVHYTCGSGGVTCWGSVEDFIDMVDGMNRSDGVADLTGFGQMEIMRGDEMFHVPVESGILAMVLPETAPALPGD